MNNSLNKFALLKNHSNENRLENNLFSYIYFTAFVLSIFTICLTSCVTRPDKTKIIKPISRNLSDPGLLSAKELTAFFMSQNPDADEEMVFRLSEYYIEEAAMEGINSDCAFAQMCLETGYLRFGNLVTPDMHNYCGLGAIDRDHRGEVFETEQLGVRAHIQHLHAYATTEDCVLKNELIDNRYKWVRPRGKAPTIFELAGTWAVDKAYAEKLDSILDRMSWF